MKSDQSWMCISNWGHFIHTFFFSWKKKKKKLGSTKSHSSIRIHTQRNRFTIPFRLKGIWSLWQFSFWLQFSFWQFSFWTASRWVHIIAVNVFLLIVTILIVTILTNTKSHYDRIPFNSKGIRDLHWRLFLTVLKKTCSRYRIGG